MVLYGTLVSNGATIMHKQIQECLERRGNCILSGELYNLGRYPGLKSGKRPIQAELYKILHERILKLLDDYEATDNENPMLPGFVRKSILLVEPQLEAWIYYYEGSVIQKKLLKTNRWN